MNVSTDPVMSEVTAAVRWDEASRADALEQLFERVVGSAESAAGYYAKGAAGKRRGARYLRLCAILLSAVGSVFPILAKLLGGPDPTWASILLAGAATAIGLDRFFGFSSAWARFIAAEMQLRQLAEQFELDWQANVAAWEGTGPTKDQVTDALRILKAFLAESHRIVRDETDLWIREFQDSLQQIDVAAQASTRAKREEAQQRREAAAPVDAPAEEQEVK